MKASTNKLAMAVLALSLTQAASASESPHQDDNKNTYWGVGIGSVLGAVIAGPPGAAIGATLGGSIGWGKDQNDALDESLTELEQRELALQQNAQMLEDKQKVLSHSQQEIKNLKQSYAMQASRLKDLEAEKNSNLQDTDFLNSLVEHYAQDIYFRSGQSETPEYAQARLASLVELLKNHPNLRVTLKGYTDPTGSAKLNAKIAQARVDGIKTLLKTEGVDESRITGMAIGEVEHVIKQSNALKVEDGQEENLESQEALAASNTVEVVTPKPKNHVLDRRVTIELSIDKLPEDQSLASLMVDEQ